MRKCHDGKDQSRDGCIIARHLMLSHIPHCARAARGHATAALPKSGMTLRRLMQLPIEDKALSKGSVVRHSKIAPPMTLWLNRVEVSRGRTSTYFGYIWKAALHSYQQKIGGSYCAGVPTSDLALRALRHSSKPCTTTKNEGTNSTARQVEAIMPVNTVMPMEMRALAPAPLASTSGSTPRIKANEVITMGRKRARAASTAASKIALPSARCSRANSTMRMAFLADSAISSTSPI